MSRVTWYDISLALYSSRCKISQRLILCAAIQYIQRNMHTVFALLCFVVVIHWLIFPYPSGLLHWHCGNLTIAPVRAKQSWWIRINTSCEFIVNDCITTTKQSTTKPCAYFLRYTVGWNKYQVRSYVQFHDVPQSLFIYLILDCEFITTLLNHIFYLLVILTNSAWLYNAEIATCLAHVGMKLSSRAICSPKSL